MRGGQRRKTARIAHAHFVRGLTSVTVLVGKASYKVAASVRHLTVLPAAREAIAETEYGRRENLSEGKCDLEAR